MAVAVTGSDGRCENVGRLSSTDCILIVKSLKPFQDISRTTPADSEENHNPILHTISKITTLFHDKDSSLHGYVSSYLEIKDLEEKQHGLLGILQMEKATKTALTRPLDATFLIGEISTFCQYKHIFVQEIQEGSVQISKFHHQFVRPEFSKITTQQCIEESGINPITGELRFIGRPKTPYQQSQKAPKYGPMRVLQYTLAEVIVKHIRKLPMNEADLFTQELPPTTCGRVHKLTQLGILHLQDEDVQNFQTTYSTLLFWYEKLQNMATRHPEQEAVSSHFSSQNCIHNVLKLVKKLGKLILGSVQG